MKILLLISILFFSLTLNAQDMKKYSRDTKMMVKEGKYEEALKRYIWFHEHVLEHDKNMAGVRLSFALSDWKALADVYPPAMKELIAMRDKKTKQIMANGGTTQLFADVEAINRTLGERSGTVKLFDFLLSKYPEIAKSNWRYAKEDLFAVKRYDVIKKFVANPMQEYSLVAGKYGRDTTLSKKLRIGGANYKAYSENHFIEKSIQLIQFAIATDNLKAAKEIQKAAVKVVDDNQLHHAIP